MWKLTCCGVANGDDPANTTMLQSQWRIVIEVIVTHNLVLMADSTRSSFPDMKNLYEAGCADEVKERLAQLRQDSPGLWGKMNAPQAVEHCARSMEWAVGDKMPPRMLVGRIIGRIVKPLALKDDEPMRRNSPTAPDLIVQGEPNLAAERQRLCAMIDRFVAAGPKGCTTHPHSFFGRLTPNEWAVLTYKHLDHHLRQFGV